MTASGSEAPRKVLVTGDVVRDHYIYQGQERRSGSTIRLGTRRRVSPGGAALLCDLLKRVASQVGNNARVFPFEVHFGLQRSKSNKVTPNGYCLLRPYPIEQGSKQQVWRMSDALGFDAAAQSYLDSAMVNEQVRDAPHDIVVLDDASLYYGRWPSRSAWPPCLYDSSATVPDWLVLKLSSPICAGDLWHTLLSGEAQEMTRPANRQHEPLLRRAVAIVSINDLRVERIHVSGALSWERVALDLVHELSENPRLERLRKCRFVIVTFDTDGALLAEFPDQGEPTFRLIFDPAQLERDYNQDLEGKLFGLQTCLTASVVAHLPKSVGTSSKVTLLSLEPAVKTGLCAMRRLLTHGHGPIEQDDEPGFPTSEISKEILRSDHDWSYGAVEVPRTVSPADAWTIVAGNTASIGSPSPLWGLARRVAVIGLDELRETPYQQFGDLFSIQRSEIESLRSLRRLLTQYRDLAKADKPLSIAVFGPPGAGKSFCVKQLAKAVFAEKVPFLEFNLSQFDDKNPAQLNGALHQVRDMALEGKLPFVFWDEFDSLNLKWLQYLLVPMQDGSFQEGQITHPVGKSVFVFAGGTRFRFQDFGAPPDDLVALADKEKLQAWERDFRARKGPDFKSRLAGYLDVFGPNPRDADDVTFPVRRALLLRVHLKKFGKQRLIIDPGLLSAFLEISVYRHGARSLEKIAEQVRLASRIGEFWRSDLPSRGQLDMHVNADEFLDLVERDP